MPPILTIEGRRNDPDLLHVKKDDEDLFFDDSDQEVCGTNFDLSGSTAVSIICDAAEKLSVPPSKIIERLKRGERVVY